MHQDQEYHFYIHLVSELFQVYHFRMKIELYLQEGVVSFPTNLELYCPGPGANDFKSPPLERY
jgi:hypothetical protein